MHSIHIPADLWNDILTHFKATPETELAKKVIGAADPADLSEEAEARRQRILEITREQNYIAEGEVEIDDNALISEDDGNGCYVAAWAWCPFAETDLDKEKETPEKQP